jgi:hypothetical protein
MLKTLDAYYRLRAGARDGREPSLLTRRPT